MKGYEPEKAAHPQRSRGKDGAALEWITEPAGRGRSCPPKPFRVIDGEVMGPAEKVWPVKLIRLIPRAA